MDGQVGQSEVLYEGVNRAVALSVTASPTTQLLPPGELHASLVTTTHFRDNIYAPSHPPTLLDNDTRMDHPSKRHKPSPPPQAHPAEEPSDFISFNTPAEDSTPAAAKYGYTNYTTAATDPPTNSQHPHNAPRHPRTHHNHPNQPSDRPKSLSNLPGHEPWVLIHTKQNRKFVHNPSTRESFWRIPEHLAQAVATAEEAKEVEREKRRNARWAEQQLKASRPTAVSADAGAGTGAGAGNVGESSGRRGNAAVTNGRGKGNRRRRSESLQREDEEALRAALAAEAEMAEERDLVDTVAAVAPLVPASAGEVGGGGGARAAGANGIGDAGPGYGSDSSYEEVEVTDSEFEDEDDEDRERRAGTMRPEEPTAQAEDEPLEFGEDDIAFQLAALNGSEDPGSASGDSQDEDEDDNDSEQEFVEGGNPFDKNIHLRRGGVEFCAMLTDHHISPYTPWEKLLADTGPESIVLDDRFTMLPSTRVRKAFWDHWARDTIALQKSERERKSQTGETEDPKIPFLAFLVWNASPKIYWTEFRRKFKKSPEMSAKGLGDKEREKLYRDFIAKSKMPERKQREEYLALLQSHAGKVMESWNERKVLPHAVRGDVRWAVLSSEVRAEVVGEFLSRNQGSEAGGGDLGKGGDGDGEAKRKKALAERARQVEEERRRVEKEERWAKRELVQGQEELRRAMV